MDPNLYQAARQLPAGDGRMAQLYQLAVSPSQPRNLAALVRKGLLWVAGLLLASGLIFWVAANWQEQSRMFRLGLIEAALDPKKCSAERTHARPALRAGYIAPFGAPVEPEV